jgi:UDP-N-acetylglucosamine--N-acetylmuramyl-(pentapeptide) pyrophosphoryl-undecaprenol N-acetylglucosamine transferase
MVKAKGKKRIGFTGGGTAGHVTPSFAIIELAQADGHEVVYFGTPDGIERELVGRLHDVKYVEIPSERLRRYADVRNLVAPFRVARGMGLASIRVQIAKPDVLFSKGGFVAFPAVVGAWMNRVPIIVHESDITSGLANRMSFPFATTICTGFEQTATAMNRANAVYTGSPVRAAFDDADPAAARAHFKLSDDRPVVVIFGGSQGARHINDVSRAAVVALTDRAQVVHVCGKGNLAPALDGTPDYHQVEYIHELFPALLKAADVVIARAGANSIAELIKLQKPAVLIPLPVASSRGDQLANAQDFARNGFGELLRDEDLTPVTLIERLDAALANRVAYTAAMARNPARDAARVLYKMLLDLA